MNGGTKALCVTAIATVSVIAYVHFEQKRELNRMKQSVLIDAERESFRRRVRAEHDLANSVKDGESRSMR